MHPHRAAGKLVMPERKGLQQAVVRAAQHDQSLEDRQDRRLASFSSIVESQTE